MSQENASGPSMNSTPWGEDEEEPIPLLSRIVHKFYEPIMLLTSLIGITREIAMPVPPEAPINIQDTRQVFHAFVNKLSHVCDSTKGGSTVTSFMVLHGEGNRDIFHYWFAVNRQTPIRLEATVAYVKALLRKVDRAPKYPQEQHAARTDLLCDILRFNRLRVSVYLKKLQPETRECLRRCEMDETDQNRLIAENITGLLDPTNVGASPNAPEADYLRKCQTLIRLLIQLRRSEVWDLITDRAREGRMPGLMSVECWSALFHTINRILAYPQSVQFFLLAKKHWPKLFDKPEVSYISSSRPIPKPIRNKSLTAESIVGRMTRKEKEMQIFKDFVRHLQAFDLDDRLRIEYGRDSFAPIIHSEVLLLNWLETHGDIETSRFFHEWMYIGSSKPTCKLCNYFFQEHDSEVEHRPSHGNLYPSWRVPDVFPSQGRVGLEARQVMVDRVLQRVRKDAFDIVRRKVQPFFKADDSNTFSATVTLENNWMLDASAVEPNNITALMGEIEITEARQGVADWSLSDDDDDGGGAIL